MTIILVPLLQMIIVSDDNVMRLTKEKKNDGLGIYGYMDIYIWIYGYISIYMVPKTQYSNIHISGSTQPNCFKLGQHGQNKSTTCCLSLVVIGHCEPLISSM